MLLTMNIRKRFRNIDEEISLAEIKSGDYILDFGCGPGFNTIPAAQKTGPDGRIFALDLSPQAINIVKKKAARYQLENIETIHSGCHTHLQDKSIDLVLLHNTLPLIKEKQKVLDEIGRVLKKGGKLSYMSRAGSRVCSRLYGKDSISDSSVKKILKYDYNLIYDVDGHLIFERN